MTQVINKDDEILDWTIEQRKDFIKKMCPDGKLPEDPKEKALVLKAYDGLDKVALGRKRIQTDTNIANSQEKAAALMAEVVRLTAKRDPYIIDINAPPNPNEKPRQIPTLPNDLKAPELVEGITAIQPGQDSYEEFMKRMGKGG